MGLLGVGCETTSTLDDRLDGGLEAAAERCARALRARDRICSSVVRASMSISLRTWEDRVGRSARMV